MVETDLGAADVDDDEGTDRRIEGDLDVEPIGSLEAEGCVLGEDPHAGWLLLDERTVALVAVLVPGVDEDGGAGGQQTEGTVVLFLRTGGEAGEGDQADRDAEQGAGGAHVRLPPVEWSPLLVTGQF